MDSVILAAIIGAAAVIIAAIIGLPKRRVRSGNFEKSQALRLGFAIAGLDYFLRMRKKGVELENRPQLVDNEIERCCIIATSIGIELPRDVDKLLNETPLKIESKPISTQKTFLIGKIVGTCFFNAINHMAALAFLGKNMDEEIAKIAMDAFARIKSEDLLTQADLPSDFLMPVEKLWKDTIQASRKGQGDPHIVGRKMESILDQLCKTIENRDDTRHSV